MDAEEQIMIGNVRKGLLYGVVALFVAFGVGFSLSGSASAGEGRVPTSAVSNTAVKPGPHPVETGMCDVLAQLGSYTYTYQGAKVKVPAGTALLKELSADKVKGKARQAACKAMVGEYAAHN